MLVAATVGICNHINLQSNVAPFKADKNPITLLTAFTGSKRSIGKLQHCEFLAL